MRMDCSVWNIKTWSNFKWEFRLASKDERYVMRFHPGLWIVFLYTFGETTAAVEQRPQMLSWRILRVWESKAKVLSKVLNSPARAPYKPTTWNTARSIWPSTAPHTHLELYFTWRVEQTQHISWTIWEMNSLIKANFDHLRRAKHCSLMGMGIGGEMLKVAWK